MFNLMPASYYSFEGGIQWHLLFAQLLCQDCLQYFMHIIEHAGAELYKMSHKPHHKHVDPQMFDAFDGSLVDTLCMIVIPLLVTKSLIHCNVWTYMAFGTSYSAWLTLIHAEYRHPWERVFHLIGFGTSSDHHVHHRLFKYNYGHIFMYWDVLFGTYRSPQTVKTFAVYDADSAAGKEIQKPKSPIRVLHSASLLVATAGALVTGWRVDRLRAQSPTNRLLPRLSDTESVFYVAGLFICISWLLLATTFPLIASVLKEERAKSKRKGM
jgi:sterol desaturase/sphingolipid hydroxylase (fatty acid hydroxylase superfamily)